jgi:hypothetical protein
VILPKIAQDYLGQFFGNRIRGKGPLLRIIITAAERKGAWNSPDLPTRLRSCRYFPFFEGLSSSFV